GLFDLTPLSLFVVTLAALAVAGSACKTAAIILHNAWARFGVGNGPLELPHLWIWLVINLSLRLPVIAFSLYLSIKESKNPVGFALAAIAGIALAVGAAWILGASGQSVVAYILPVLLDQRLENYLRSMDVLAGYVRSVPQVLLPSGEVYDPWQ